MIPNFDMSGVLPPYIIGGTPTDPTHMSPYISDIVEFSTVFATSHERIALLRGFIAYRAALTALGVTQGFQWIDGSFVEAIEITAKRPPGDVDIITFFRRPPDHQDDNAWHQFFLANKQMFSPQHIKTTYSCDAYPVDLNLQTEDIVNHTRYWFGLFSHKKITNQWKGIVQISLDSNLDTAALVIISEKEANL